MGNSEIFLLNFGLLVCTFAGILIGRVLGYDKGWIDGFKRGRSMIS